MKKVNFNFLLKFQSAEANDSFNHYCVDCIPEITVSISTHLFNFTQGINYKWTVSMLCMPLIICQWNIMLYSYDATKIMCHLWNNGIIIINIITYSYHYLLFSLNILAKGKSLWLEKHILSIQNIFSSQLSCVWNKLKVLVFQSILCQKSCEPEEVVESCYHEVSAVTTIVHHLVSHYSIKSFWTFLSKKNMVQCIWSGSFHLTR